MKITEEVKIGGIPYKVIECANPSEDNSNIDGLISYHKQEIRLKNDMSKEYKENVFMHEIMHGIFEMVGIDQDENVITRISNAMHQVIKDNPDIFTS